MDIAMDTANEFAKSALGLVWQQLVDLFEYSSNIKDLEERVENIKNERIVIQSRVTAAERNGERIFTHVIKWLDDSKSLLEEAEKFLNEEIKADTHVWHLGSRYKLSAKAKQKILVVEQLLGTCKTFNVISENVPPPPIELASDETRSAFGSRKEILAKIVDNLKDDRVPMIGIYGLAGVGKTTFVKQIGERLQSERLFDHIMIFTVSQTPDILKIQDRIAEVIGAKTFDEKTTEGRASRLHAILNQMLKHGKKILVIVDDIWETLNLRENIGIPVGCKFMLTSRQEGVCQQMGSQHNYMLRGLNDGESWSLFENIVGHNAVKHPHRHQIAVKTVKACGGLPLALNVIASLLRNNNNIYCWQDAVAKLRWNDLAQNLTESLKLSYEFLEKESAAQELLLLCSLFPEDYEIHINDLLTWGLGLGLFRDVASLDASFVRVHARVEYLKSSSLLLDVEGKNCVKMHDVVREFTLKVAREQHKTFVGTGEELISWKESDTVNYISLHGDNMNVFNDKLEYPNLKLLYLRGTLSRNLSSSILGTVFGMMKMITVLSFFKVTLNQLPPSFEHLKHLRTLTLVSCILGDIRIIGELRSLRILNLSRSTLSELPIEFEKLHNLLFLDLTGCLNLAIVPSRVLHGMRQLEGLHMSRDLVYGGIYKLGDASLEHLRFCSQLVTLEVHIVDIKHWPKGVVFSKLRRFKISVGSEFHFSEPYACSSKLILLKDLTRSSLEHGLNGLLKIAEEIIIENVNGFQNDLYHNLDRAHVCNLKYLSIARFEEIQYVVDTTEIDPCVVFPLLKILKINDLDNFYEICHGKPLEGSFGKLEELRVSNLPKLMNVWKSPIEYALLPMLRVLNIEQCHRLKNIFTLSKSGDLSQLRHLEVCSCEAIEEIIDSEDGSRMLEFVFHELHSLLLLSLPKLKTFMPIGRPSPTIADVGTHIKGSLFDGKVAFPNLKDMHLKNLDSVGQIWTNSFRVGVTLPLLDKLEVEGLPNLMHVWSIDSPESIPLSSLTRLTIENCPINEVVLAQEEDTAGSIEFLRLEYLRLDHLRNLKSFYAGQGNCALFNEKISTTHMKEKHSQLESFQQRTITHPALKRLILKWLDNIKDLWCPRLPVESLTFHHLGWLEVVGLPKLEYVFDNKVRLPALKDLWVQELYNIKVLWCPKHPVESPTFHHLKILRVHALPKLEYLFDGKVSFPALEHLYVDGMEGLREIWQIPQPVGSFPQLRRLSVWNCHNLLNIGPFLQLPSLELLSVIRCNNLEEIFGDPVGELEHANVAMPALKDIVLCGNPVLKSFCHYKIDFEWPCLRLVKLTGCPKMKTFTYGNLTTPMLQELRLASVLSRDQRTMWNGDLNSTVRVLYSENNNNHDHNTGSKRNYNDGITMDENNKDRGGGANDDCDVGSNYDDNSNNADDEERNDDHHDKKRRRIR